MPSYVCLCSPVKKQIYDSFPDHSKEETHNYVAYKCITYECKLLYTCCKCDTQAKRDVRLTSCYLLGSIENHRQI